ncbi:peptide ABC transporter substrate-binding protein [Corynebacterium suranareeae]|uniref:Peptide ABC transporter substrate-binding protein n=1 Tax=Corynebacterium suranareeae TaxID=2506452 RepID=A0A160PN55_9CORY|nr:ABC transporter substrate-binding protein [Corynebacterium suranareeae]BAU94774.1 peptide ABC transporter substrate-binding protein [Corynebacterium suranareeae]
MTHSYSHRIISRSWLRKTAALITAATLVLGTAACGTSASETSAANGEPHNGGDLIFQIDSLGDNWVPNSSSISSFQGNIWGEITDKLVYVDEKGEISPWIAESWEESEDATTFTLHLKDGVTFSDGSALDAEAVVANIDIWAKGAPDEGISRIGLFPSSNYVKSTAIDSTTVEVEFSAPTLGFIPTLGYHGSILISPDSLSNSIEEQGDLSNNIGSGPFVVESWANADFVTLKKREDYSWGPEARGHTGPAYLDSITYKQIPETSLRAGSLQSNQADVVYNLTPQELSGLKNAGYNVATPKYLGFVQGYALNTQVAPFDDVRVRQAFQRGIDRDQILETVYTEDWSSAQSFIQSNVPESTDNTDVFSYDPDLAKSLLDEAGWVEGTNGIRVKDGKTLSVTLFPNPYVSTSQAADELAAQQLGDLGFDVNIQVYDVPTYTERVNSNKEVQAKPISRSFVDAGTVAGVIVGAKEGDEDWFKVGTTDETLNRLATNVLGSADRENRAEDLDELQKYILEQGLYIPLVDIVQRIYVTSPDLHDVTYNGLAYASFATAWLER